MASEYSSFYSSSRRLSDSSRSSSRSSAEVQRQRQQMLPPLTTTDGDGGLIAALSQSIEHHSRMIDGEGKDLVVVKGVKGVKGVTTKSLPLKPPYDPYRDDDHITLAPEVELNYSSTKVLEDSTKLIPPALRHFVANSAVSDGPAGNTLTSFSVTIAKQQQKIEKLQQDDYFGRFINRNISSWFGGGEERTVRFDDAALVADGGESVVGGFEPRTPTFFVPAPTNFRTTTRHPSHIPPSSQYDDVEARLDAPRRMYAARKRHRRNDSMLRLMIAILCFGFSLAFATIYGQGRFGMALTTMAYDRKAVNRPDLLGMTKNEPDYPDWWEDEKGIPDMDARDVKLSPILEYNSADVTTPFISDRIETPFFWTVPRSGGNVIRTIMSTCLNLAEASEFGAGIYPGSDSPFLVVLERLDGKRFVNVDMTTANGLARARELKIASSMIPDVIISGEIQGVLEIFNKRNRARIFAVFRHPLERATSKYYADLAAVPELTGLTFPQYMLSPGDHVENNYLTRTLSGRHEGILLIHHLDVAREFLRSKFVVGLASDLPTSAEMFIQTFGWLNMTDSVSIKNLDLCDNNVYNSLSQKSPPVVAEGSEGYNLLIAENWFDLKLYEYVEHLFQMQLEKLKER